MPSKQTALLVAALVVLSGCSAVPFVGGDEGARPTVGEPPEHHEVVFASNTGGFAYDANVTVFKDGEVRYQRTIENDGSSSYLNLTELEEPGPYTVTVNTTIPAAGDDKYRSERFQVDGQLGSASVIRIAYLGIYHRSLELPREFMKYDDAINVPSSYYNSDGSNRLDVDFRIWYRGDKYIDETRTISDEGHNKLLDLKRTGVYRIEARGKDGEWVSKTVVIADPNKTVTINVHIDGSIRDIEVKPPWGYR